MQWILDNWLILLLVGGMVVMHLFGHGHGGHGRRGKKPHSAGERAAHGHETRYVLSDASGEKPPSQTGSSDDRRT